MLHFLDLPILHSKQIREDEPTSFIRAEKFERVAMRLILERTYPGSTEDVILRAFQVCPVTALFPHLFYLCVLLCVCLPIACR